MAEIEYKSRIRIEVSTSVKGIKTYSATMEMLDVDQSIVLRESDKLIKELDRRYPVSVIEEKKW